MLEIEDLLIRYALLRQGLNPSQVNGYVLASREGVLRREEDALESRCGVLSNLREAIRCEADNPANDLLSMLELMKTGSVMAALGEELDVLAGISETPAVNNFAVRLMLGRLSRILPVEGFSKTVTT
jgi:hypothetical protein